MTLEPAVVADAVVNVLGAGGALVVARELGRTDPLGPVTRRVVFALRFVALLFLVRTASWLGESGLADSVAVALASATPLVSLPVAEGLLRQHAPRSLKLALIAGPLCILLAEILPPVRAAASVYLLPSVVAGGFAAIALLLWRRDRGGLTRAENALIDRVLVALVPLAILILTDFRSLWPELPVRLGAVGALVLLYVGLGTSTLDAPLHVRVLNVALFLGIAGVLALAYAATAADSTGIGQQLRAAAVALSALLFAALYSEAHGVRLERSRVANGLADAGTPDILMRRLAEHPILAGARMLPDQALGEARHPAFDSLLAQHKLLRRAAHPWGRSPIDDGVERAMSLMMAHEATHLAVMTQAPLRILAVSLPALANDARAEAEIETARLAGELAYLKAATR